MMVPADGCKCVLPSIPEGFEWSSEPQRVRILACKSESEFTNKVNGCFVRGPTDCEHHIKSANCGGFFDERTNRVSPVTLASMARRDE